MDIYSPGLHVGAQNYIPCGISSNAICLASREERGGNAVSCFNVLCMRSCLPFCAGLTGSMRSSLIPSFIHQTDSLLSPPILPDAKGVPLSDLIDRGMPYFLKRSIKTAFALAVSIYHIVETAQYSHTLHFESKKNS